MADQIPNDLQPVPNDLQAPPDVVGRAKAFLTAEPTTPRPDYLGVGGPDLGQYVRAAGRFMLPNTKGELARDVAMGAVPLSKIFAPGSRILAPAAERVAYSGAQPILENGDVEQGGKQAASTAMLETLMATLGLPRAFRDRNQPGPVVHQAANFQRPQGPGAGPTPPIVFNRVGGGGAPTVTGGGAAAVTPNTVTVQPPSSGAPIYGGQSPAAILQETLPKTPPAPVVPQWLRGAVDVTGQKPIPGTDMPSGIPAGLGALARIKEFLGTILPHEAAR